MSKKIGWQPMPVALKIIFVFVAIGTFFSLLSLTSVGQVGYTLFGYSFTGLSAFLLALIISVGGSIAFLVGLWQRLPWAGYFGAGYFGYFIVNSLLSIFSVKVAIDAALEDVVVPSDMPDVTSLAYTSAYLGIAVGVVINLVILVLIIKNLDYFKQS